MKRKVYLETSVISYLTARPSKTIVGAAHQQITSAWWERRDEYELVVSESVLRECGAGDADAAQRRLNIVADLPMLLINEEAPHCGSPGCAGYRSCQGGGRCLAHCCCNHLWRGLLADVELPTYRKPGNAAKHRSYLEQIGLFLPFICTPEELLGEENAE